MNIPAQLKYTKDHEWIRLEGNIATIGITDFAQSELGDIVYVEIETVGKSLEAEAIFGTVEAVKTVSARISNALIIQLYNEPMGEKNSRCVPNMPSRKISKISILMMIKPA